MRASGGLLVRQRAKRFRRVGCVNPTSLGGDNILQNDSMGPFLRCITATSIRCRRVSGFKVSYDENNKFDLLSPSMGEACLVRDDLRVRGVCSNPDQLVSIVARAS